MANVHTISDFASQFVVACNICTCYHLLTVQEERRSLLFPLVLLLYAPLLYCVNRLFLRRERTMRDLCVLNVLVGVLLLAVSWWIMGWGDWIYLLYAVLFIAWLTGRSGRTALSGSDLKGNLLCLDASIVMLLLFVVYQSVMDLEPTWVILPVSGFTAAVLSVISYRSSRTFGWREWCFLAAALGMILAGMWVLLYVVAVPAGQGIVALWDAAVTALRLAGKLLIWLLMFLISLFPATDGGELPPMEERTIELDEIPMAEENPALMASMLIVVVLLAVAGLAWLLYRLCKYRIGGKKSRFVGPAARRTRISFWHGLQRWIAAWKQKQRMRVYLWKYWDTPRGLYVLLVHRCRKARWKKQPGETPREFLTRLQSAAQGDLELAQALERLAPEVDAALYSGSKPTKRLEYASVVRQRVQAAMRRQWWQDKQEHFQMKIKSMKAG